MSSSPEPDSRLPLRGADSAQTMRRSQPSKPLSRGVEGHLAADAPSQPAQAREDRESTCAALAVGFGID